MSLTAGEWFLLGYGLGGLSLAVGLLWAVVVGDRRARIRRRTGDDGAGGGPE